MTDLHALRERVRAASGPDRKIDREIQAYMCEHVLGWSRTTTPRDVSGKHGGDDLLLPPSGMPRGFTYPPKGKIHKWYHVPNEPITASQDAALALVEKVLPGCEVGLDPIFFEETKSVKWDAIICCPDWDAWVPVHSEWIKITGARNDYRIFAILDAMLTALIEKEPGND